VTSPPAPRVRALSIHAGYRCRDSGVCCSSGWDIPVEPVVEGRLRAALRSGDLRPGAPVDTIRTVGLASDFEPARSSFRTVAGLPHRARVVLRTDDAGRCVFLDPRRAGSGLCTVHRDLGEEALPSACRQFPRVVTLAPIGVSITLSHWCPTAAAALFADGALSVVEDPPGFPPSWPYQGLDARDALPPLLRPGVLMDWPSLDRWERFAVSVLADDVRSPETALDALAAAAEEARRWTPDDGAFAGSFDRVLDGDDPVTDRVRQPGTRPLVGGWGSRSARLVPRATHALAPATPSARPLVASFARGDRQAARSRIEMTAAWELVVECVPHRALLPPAPDRLDEADGRWVSSTWPTLGRPIRRWLAAKAFASWIALQGEGLRTTVAFLRIALALLRAEAARGCAEAARPLEPEILKEAVRRADLLLVHLADPEALARRLSRGEAAGEPPAAW
jgi:Fe-S-cluster containining protein